jgi:aldehyde dehydrogenase (NAD+)
MTTGTVLQHNSTDLSAPLTPGSIPTKPMFIDGEWIASTTGEWRDIVSPARHGLVLARVPSAGAEDVDRAVRSARRAWPGWRDQHFTARQRALLKIADAIDARAEELAQITAADTGNAIRTQARPEVATLVDLFRYFGGVAGEVKGVTLPAGAQQLQYTRQEPLGVVAGILPWNSPLMIAGFKVPAALAAGNTMVLKAAEDAPLSILMLAEICADHLPAGVLNVITGEGRTAGAALVNHPGVDKVSFTGSTEVGREIVRTSAGNLKRVNLELGGKNASIVLKDADIDAAVGGNLFGGLVNTGQACAAYSRFYVDASRADEFTDKLAGALSTISMGPGLSPNTQLGPLISAEQRERVERYVASGLEQGARVVVGGKRPGGELAAGFFYEPTLFVGVEQSMQIAREEIFGPVLPVITYDDPEELVARANDSEYGLAACVWTKDVALGHRLAAQIRAGEVYINTLPMLDPAAPWGGFKGSGWGREMTAEALDSYTETKGVWVNLGG